MREIVQKETQWVLSEQLESTCFSYALPQVLAFTWSMGLRNLKKKKEKKFPGTSQNRLEGRSDGRESPEKDQGGHHVPHDSEEHTAPPAGLCVLLHWAILDLLCPSPKIGIIPFYNNDIEAGKTEPIAKTNALDSSSTALPIEPWGLLKVHGAS